MKTTEWAKFTVTMLGIDLLMQYKDTVTSPV